VNLDYFSQITAAKVSRRTPLFSVSPFVPFPSLLANYPETGNCIFSNKKRSRKMNNTTAHTTWQDHWWFPNPNFPYRMALHYMASSNALVQSFWSFCETARSMTPSLRWHRRAIITVTEKQPGDVVPNLKHTEQFTRYPCLADIRLRFNLGFQPRGFDF
jgi:hypothetical protein